MKKLILSLIHSMRAPGNRSTVTARLYLNGCQPAAAIHWRIDPPRPWHTQPDHEGLLHVIPDSQ